MLLTGALALILPKPVLAGDSDEIAEDPDPPATAVASAVDTPNQVLELPQSCAPDGDAYSCDDSQMARDLTAQPEASPSASGDSQDSEDLSEETAEVLPEVGTISDYENQGIAEDPIIINTTNPLTGGGLVRPSAGGTGPSPIGSMASAPMYTSAVPLTSTWTHPLLGPAAGAPSFVSSRGVPMLMSPRPFFHR